MSRPAALLLSLSFLTACEHVPSIVQPYTPSPWTAGQIVSGYLVSLEDRCEDPADDAKTRTLLETAQDILSIPWNGLMMVVLPVLYIGEVIIADGELIDAETGLARIEKRYGIGPRQAGPPERQTLRIAGQTVDLGPTKKVPFGCGTT